VGSSRKIDKFTSFSIVASVRRLEGQEPISEAKMNQLLQRLVRGWEEGLITIHDVIEKNTREEKHA